MRVSRKTLAIALSLIALLLLSLCLAAVIARSETGHDFTLRTFASTPSPQAIFERRAYFSRRVRPAGTSFETRVWVLRHKEWTQLDLSEVQNIVGFQNHIADGLNRSILGYTVTVKVPVCERWKIETVIGQTRRVGWNAFGLNFTSTNRWTSDELPGWSLIRQQFNAATP